MTTVPDQLIDLLERPIIAHLGTVRPDGKPQVNPMWFSWDGEIVRFTHTNARQKYKNLALNPAVAIAFTDPASPYRYLELRGRVARVVPDPTGAFYQELSRRYGNEDPPPPPDAPNRVILEVVVEAVSGR